MYNDYVIISFRECYLRRTVVMKGYFPSLKMCCGYSLELPCWGITNKYPQYIYFKGKLWKLFPKYPDYSSYLELWSCNAHNKSFFYGTDSVEVMLLSKKKHISLDFLCHVFHFAISMTQSCQNCLCLHTHTHTHTHTQIDGELKILVLWMAGHGLFSVQN